MPPAPRDAHPYYMHDHILAQPQAVFEVVTRLADPVRAWSSSLRSRSRGFLVGTGTSFHAAQIGEFLNLLQGDRRSLRAVPAYDFANYYGAGICGEDFVIVISHRGTKRFSRRALEIAHTHGAATALITGRGSPGCEQADVVFSTVEQERSSAHTVSLTSAVAILALAADVPPEFLSQEFPRLLRDALSQETRVGELARRHSGPRRIWIVGGGPAGIVAQEIALKIKETSYLQAEGMATESMLHGPFQGTDTSDLFVLVAPAGVAQARTLELLPMIHDVGAAAIVVGPAPSHGTDNSVWIETPAAAEPFGAMVCLAVLQLFAYHLSLARGTNPDSFRLEDVRFATACQRITL